LEEKYDKFATIYHEIAHVKHIKKEIITKKGRFLLKELTPKQLEKFKKTVSLISPYATKNYVEFVAEFYEKMVSRFIEIRKESPKMPVFLAKIKAKREWPKNLRILYKKSGGPAL
jgi:predicted ATPase